MLARYPGLTLVGGLAIAFAIWIGAGTFELATQVVRPTIPLPEGGASSASAPGTRRRTARSSRWCTT
jgi:hypothetical protein